MRPGATAIDSVGGVGWTISVSRWAFDVVYKYYSTFTAYVQCTMIIINL